MTARPFASLRRSLPAKLLVPVLGIGVIVALASGLALYALFKAHARADMTRWARSLADSVNYAAESSDNLADLERFVTALGAEPEIRTIVVAAGSPARVIAATRMAWWRRPLAQIPDSGLRRHLEQADTQEAHTHWAADGEYLISVAPLRIHKPDMDTARLAGGAVYVELDARAELAHQRFHAALASGALGAAILLLTGLGLWLVQRRVIAPVRAIQAAVERRHEGDRNAYAPVAAPDVIGRLANATNRLLDIQAERETLFQQMFAQHPAVKILIDAEDGTIIDVNRAAEAFYGYPRSALIGQALTRINVLPREELAEVLDRAREAGELAGEFRHRLADGEIRDVRVQTALLEVADRTYLHSIVHDITEEKRSRNQLEVYEHLFRNLPVGIFRTTTGPEGRFLEANPAMAELFEADDPRALGRYPVVDLYEDPDEREAILAELKRTGQIRRREARMRTLKGNVIWGNLTAYLYQDAYGTQFVDGILEDISERKAAEEALRHAEKRLRTLIEHFPGGVLMEDTDRRILVANQSLCDMFQMGASPQEVVGGDCRAGAEAAKDLFTDPEGFVQGIERILAKGEPVRGEELTMTDGRVLERDYLPIPGDDGLLGHLWLYRDVTERKALEAQLEHQATHDRLTGVFNRLKFEELTEQELTRAQRYGAPFSLIMLDIDRFKQVNDIHGHAVGDSILRELTALLQPLLRDPDTLARWGGEEFMVLLPETGQQGALEVAERLRRAVAEHPFPGPGSITISLGVAEYRAELALKGLFKRVDDALYRAKTNGRNRVEVLDGE